MNYFTIGNVPMGKHYDRCANMGLFHNKYPIDKDQSLSNVTTNQRIYEYITYESSSSNALSRRTDLREDKICDIFLREI